MGLCRDNGKEHGNYYRMLVSNLRQGKEFMHLIPWPLGLITATSHDLKLPGGLYAVENPKPETLNPALQYLTGRFQDMKLCSWELHKPIHKRPVWRTL